MLVLKINEDPVKMQDRLQCLLNPASGKPVKVQTKRLPQAHFFRDFRHWREVRPLVLADNYDDQPDADRAGHKAVPVQVGLILAGSI